MAMDMGTILVNVKADTAQLVAGFNKAEAAVNKTTKQMSYAVKGLIGAFVGLNTLDIAKNFTKQLDTITSANNKLKLVTKTTGEFTNAQKELFRVAQLTAAGYSETVTLYSKLSDSMTTMGKSQSDIVRTVETVNKAIAISGSTAQESAAAILQLGQAFGSGKLQGDELKSITENAQGLAKAIADGMEVEVGALKQLGSEGKITSEILATALEKVASSTDEKYGKMTKTIAQSSQIVSNSIQKIIGDFDKMNGISNVIADTIQGISKALENLNANDLESMFNTFKLSAELIVGAYVALKLLRGGLTAYNIISNITTEIEKKRTTATLLQANSLKAKELAELASLKSANSYNLVTKQAEFQTQSQIKSTQKLQSELLKQSVAIEKNVVNQTVMNDKLRGSVVNFNSAAVGATTLRIAMSAIPFIAITTGLGLLADSFLSTSKNSDIFRESLTKTVDELERLTRSQRELRINIATEELEKAQKDLREFKSYLDNLGTDVGMSIMTEEDIKRQEQLRVRLQANVDTQQELVDKTREHLDTLVSINENLKGNKFVNIKTVIPKEESSIINWLVDGEKVIEKKLNITVDAPSLDMLSDEVKKLIAPIDVITEKYGLLFKNLIDAGKGTAENIAKINDAMNEEIGNLDKQGIQKQKTALKEKEKAYNETQEKIKALMKEATDLTISDVDKINAKYLEMYDVIKNSFTTEQLNAFNTAWQESVDKVNGTLDAQKAKLDLVNQALATITSELDTVNNKYLEMYEAIKDNPLFDEAKMSEFFKKWQDEVDKLGEKLDFSSTIELDIIGEDKSIQRIQKSFDDLNKSTKKYEENRTKIAKGSAEEAQNEEMYKKDQINGFINLTGALGSMFEKGSKEAEAFTRIQAGLAAVSGVNAVLAAAALPPPMGFASMATMAVSVASLLSSIGVAFKGIGGTSTTTTSDAFSSQTANTGTSTILGDATKASESMLNAMSTLEDFAQPQYSTLLSMNDYLESIANSIGGVSNLLIKNSGYALGSGYEGFDTGFSNNLSVSSGIIGTVLNPINSLLSNIPVIGQINDLFGGIINTALGGLFGKTSVSQALTDSGINFADAYLRDAIIQLDGSAYQTIATTTKKKSWFSSSSKTNVSTYFQGLNDEIERQFSLVLGGLYSTVFEAGNALDINANSLSNSLDNFVVSIGKISLKDKTSDQIQELLTNVFSSIGDNLASTAVPALTGFQGVGEGLFETLVRVATGIEEASFYSDRLGTSIVKYTDIANKQGVVGFEALAQSIIAADEATYGFNNGVVQIIDNLNLTAEELYSTYLTFGDIRDVLEATNQSASNLSSAMITGAGSISALESGTSSYMENFLSDTEQVNIQMSRLSDEFSIAGYALPQTREDFVSLINGINTSTDEGAKAYGRLISLSDEYSDAISALEDIQAEALATQAEAVLNLKNQLLSLTQRLEDSKADDAQQLLLTRQRELANYTDATSLALLNQIYAQEDLNTALDEQASVIEDMQTAIDALSATFLNLGDSVASTIATLEGSSTDAIGTTNQIKSFWEKRQEIDALLALNGNLTDAQQTTLTSLVGEVNSLATSIQGEQIGSNQLISDELISNLSGLKDNLDLEGQVLSVTIVGIASNVDLISTIASTSSVPTLSNIVTSYTNTDVLSTEIKDILSIIKDNLATYPKRTFDLLDNVINGNQKVRVQS